MFWSQAQCLYNRYQIDIDILMDIVCIEMEECGSNRSGAPTARSLQELEIKAGIFANLQALSFLHQLVSYEPHPVLAALSISA